MNNIFKTILLLFLSSNLFAQVNFTAKDLVPVYNDGFLYGTNMGYNPGWTDDMIANAACGTGENELSLNSLRPFLPDEFVAQWGYDVRLREFNYYASLGAINNTVNVGYPAADHRDLTEYCDGESSKLFEGMYEDIWIDGANGKQINPENYYATYLWNVVSRYKGQVRFWEIWNEPDFDYSGTGASWRPSGDGVNWWDENPQPCHTALKAPIFHYIRLLRISYDVIKTLDPDAYVAIGGLGYPSFLDAILRNTDNPNEGAVSADFPHKGGAYFDCLSFHIYPSINGSLDEWNNDKGDFDYFRNSDRAAEAIPAMKKDMDAVLIKHKYDGDTYPKKTAIITETNIPTAAYGKFIGGDEVQRNYLIKAAIQSQMNGIDQICVYDMAEKQFYRYSRLRI